MPKINLTQAKKMTTFKQFLIKEVAYEDGIDVEFDEHGRIVSKKPVVATSKTKKDEPRSEAEASYELDKHIAHTRNPQANAMTLSAAEQRRAEERKKNKKPSLAARITGIVKKSLNID
jgi:hypothetical protein